MTPATQLVLFSRRPRLSDASGYAAEYSGKHGVLNTVAPDALATNTLAVRRWLDLSGNGRHLDQATALNQPTYSLTGGRPGILADGVNSSLANIGGFPSLTTSTIYLVGRQLSWTSGDFIYDARLSGGHNGIMMWQRSSTPRIAVNTTTSTNLTAAWAVGVDSIVTARTPAFTGACFIQVNDNAEEEFAIPAGLTANNSFYLFSSLVASDFANILLYALVIYTANHDAATRAMVRAELKRQWRLP